MDYEYDCTQTIFNFSYKVNVTITNLTLVNIQSPSCSFKKMCFGL